MSSSGSSRRCPTTNGTRSLSTVDKTIEYFNAVVVRVIATILKEQDERVRANVIEKWIDVAHQCRKLKNFSSLTAILNGLLSGSIYRLTTAWSHVNEDYLSILEELKNVFGSCADRKQAREILDKVSGMFIITGICSDCFFFVICFFLLQPIEMKLCSLQQLDEVRLAFPECIVGLPKQSSLICTLIFLLIARTLSFFLHYFTSTHCHFNLTFIR